MQRSTQQVSNLNKITEFNHALIYCFQAETSLAYPPEDQFNTSCHILGQYEDMAMAYDYAQQVLARIRRRGVANVTPTQVLEWINQIHGRVAATMAADYRAAGFPMVAGQYSRDIQQIRWRCSTEVQTVLKLYLAKQSPYDATLIVMQAHGVNGVMANVLLKLLDELRSATINLLPTDLHDTPHTQNLIQRFVEDRLVALSMRYHADQLTMKQRQAVDHVVKICLPPEKMPQAMQEFAEQFVAAWQRCDPNDEDQICRLAYNAFKGVTEIHPYFNCNGRTATCWMNVILRAMNKPSILLRLPGERDNASSAYSQAIAGINTQPELFIRHVQSRIRDALDAPYTNSAAAAGFAKRMEVSGYIDKIQRQFPQYLLAPAFTKILEKVADEIELELGRPLEIKADDYECQLGVATKIVASLAPLYQVLLRQTQSVVQRTYTESEQTAIVAKLEALTGLDKDKWQCYKTAGLTVLYRLGNPESSLKRANEIAAALNETGALRAKVQINYGSTMLRLEGIHPEKLNDVDSLRLESVQQEQSTYTAAAGMSQ